ncbi:MAG: hypothetical protein EXR58_03095 [Chloroflexi bacterium]|nr:hypothetical protein [Chloroflexota bacterium]
MKTKKDVMFAFGIALGTAAGFVLGSVIAFRVGEAGVESARRLVERVLGRERGPHFEFLLQ